jgi:uncharacterized protein
MKSEISRSDNMFSGFGQYQIDGKAVLNMPNNTITLQDMDNGKFSYSRTSNGNITKKIIQSTLQAAQIEIVPVLPVHVPSYKTDFFFLRFDETLFVESGSTMHLEVCIPIEIGIFAITEGKSSGFDFFSCDPLNSRFGLYGTPEDGKLCKYGLVSAKRCAPQEFMQALLRLEITNELHELASVGKIVFPVTDHDLHYHNNDVIMDGLHATIKNRVGLHIIETVQNPEVTSRGWKLASRDTEKTDYKFSMERGFD